MRLTNVSDFRLVFLDSYLRFVHLSVRIRVELTVTVEFLKPLRRFQLAESIKTFDIVRKAPSLTPSSLQICFDKRAP